METKEELNKYIKDGKNQKIDLEKVLKALAAIESITSLDISGTAEEKLSDIYFLAHYAINHCKGCNRKIINNNIKIEESYKAMLHFGQADDFKNRIIILPDNTEVTLNF